MSTTPSKQRHIIYIINPVSGTKDKQKTLALIEQKTTEANIPYKIVHSVANGDYLFLLSEIEHNNTSAIVIAGGDGTISQVIGSLINHTNIDFGIIPLGSGNGLAFGAHISKNVEEALSTIFKGEAQETDGFYVNEKFACMLSGIGFDAKVAHDFAQQNTRGLMTYITQVIKNFFSARSFQFTIRIAEKQFRTEAFFISIANSNQFGNNFTIAPKARLSDGLLDIIIVTEQNKLSLLLQTLKQVTGFNNISSPEDIDEEKSIIYFQVPALTIYNHDKAPLHIDGDPVSCMEELHISIKEKCFKLLS